MVLEHPSPLRTGPVSKDLIVRHIRGQIVTGELAPGSQLPPRNTLEQFFGTTSATVQRAFDHLTRDEFVVVRRQRTYVSTTPPHLTRYALVFPARHREDRPWSNYWKALNAEAMELERNSSRQMPQFHGIYEGEDPAEFARLVEEVEAHRLAGLIFLAHPGYVRGTPLLMEPGIPRVALTDVRMPGISNVSTDYVGFFERALDYLAAQKRKRVAVLAEPISLNSAAFLEAARARGIESRPYWVQTVSLAFPESANSVVQLLMNSRDRPDALIIADDNLLEQATAGLAACGLRIPEDLEVVAHTNFPWPAPSHVPVKRLGYDIRQVLGHCVASIDAQRSGPQAHDVTKVPPVFEDEIIRS